MDGWREIDKWWKGIVLSLSIAPHTLTPVSLVPVAGTEQHSVCEEHQTRITVVLLTFLCCFLSLELLRGSVQLQGSQECLCVLERLRLTVISVPAWSLVALVVD